MKKIKVGMMLGLWLLGIILMPYSYAQSDGEDDATWVIPTFEDDQNEEDDADTWVIPAPAPTQPPINILFGSPQDTENQAWVIGDLGASSTITTSNPEHFEDTWVLPYPKNSSDTSSVPRDPVPELKIKPKEFVTPAPKRAPIVKHPSRAEKLANLTPRTKTNIFRGSGMLVKEKNDNLALDKSSALKEIPKTEGFEGFVLPAKKEPQNIPVPQTFKASLLEGSQKSSTAETNEFILPNFIKPIQSPAPTTPTQKIAKPIRQKIRFFKKPIPKFTNPAAQYVRAIEDYKAKNKIYLNNLENENFHTAAPATHLMSWEGVEEDIANYKLSLIQKQILKTILITFLFLTFTFCLLFLISQYRQKIVQTILRFKFPPPIR